MEGTQETQAQEAQSLTLSRHRVDTHGRSQFRASGNRNTTVRFGANFFAGQVPDVIVVTASNIAGPTVPKPKLTKEQRAALPKPTPQEKLELARERAARAKARMERLEAALAAQAAGQPAAEVATVDAM